MRMLRLILAVLISLGVAVGPATAAMPHAAQTAMSMEVVSDAPADDCTCCDVTHKCAMSSCIVTCHVAPALVLAQLALPAPLPFVHPAARVVPLATVAWRPEPPPPRS